MVGEGEEGDGGEWNKVAAGGDAQEDDEWVEMD